MTSLQFSVFGAALPLIVSDLNIGYGFMGLLIAAWTVVSALTPLILGRLIDRLPPLWIIVLVLLISTLSSILTAYSYDLTVLNLARILLSLSFPFVWPISSRLVAAYVSSQRYGYSTAIFNTGSMIGFAASYIVMALAYNDWRFAMVMAGVVTLAYIPIIIIAWRAFLGSGLDIGRNIERQTVSVEAGRQEVPRGVVDRIGILLSLAHFCALYMWGILITWLSTFLVYELRLSYSEIAQFLSLVTVVSSILEVSAGIYSDRMGGLKGRALILFLGLTPSGILLLLAVEFAASSPTALVLVSLAALAWRVSTPSFWSIINDVIPPKYLGRISYMYVSAAPLSGIASSTITSAIITFTNSVRLGMLISAAITSASPIIYFVAARIGYELKSREHV
ncbi:MAG: MFS transporter [Nitrososphaerota archaeon]|nr:MFS transporter [Nitrososphaerota archaeon]